MEHSVAFELGVGAIHRVGIDRQIHGHLTDGGQLIAGSQFTERDGMQDLLPELEVDGNTAGRVEVEQCSRLYVLLS